MVLSVLLLSCVVLGCAIGVGAQEQPLSGSFTCENTGLTPAYSVEIDWQVTDDLICFTAFAKTSSGWLGIAVGNETIAEKKGNHMYDGDFYISQALTSDYTLSDYHMSSTRLAPPSEDTAFGCPLNAVVPPMSSLRVDGTTQISFCRKLVTEDTECDNFISLTEPNLFLCAGGNVSGLTYHGVYRGFTTQILSGDTDTDADSTGHPHHLNTPVNYRAWHGSLMFFAFAILMPWGVFVARFLKQFWWWFPLHICMQLLAVILATVSFILIVVEVDSAQQFSFWHAYIGLTTLILSWLSPVLGLLSHLMWDPSRESTPFFPDMVHWWVARLAILGGFVSIYLGVLRLYNAFSEGSEDLIYAFSILVVFYLTAYLAVEIANRKPSQRNSAYIQVS